ncbi:DNA-binding transcriptional LysR family regulator [Kitasatospora sp. MAP12-15]|uniref:LysR family transcriptional regulator n=1 Tax=unclassified Kitasatospora TaxID=2633591 RepID=UPI002473DA9C|nr:LysR family transcriptional regulator [Kitasatospora sp. MAP12-44]MDH6108411.1 DNA-binding transcriptional LysR family regulator [Kitasatospora sp. MAP12-44]
MEQLELRHLRLVCAIADTGGLRRAAALLGYSQPAVSTQLQRIEGYFGGELFLRSRAGAVPTPFGVEVVAQARDVLAQVDAIGRRPAGDAAGAGRVLRLAATNTPILSGLVARIRKALPDLALTVSSVYSSAEIVELLEAGELDAAIGTDYPGRELQHSDAVAHRGIVTEPSFVALPADHRLAHRIEVSLSELAEDAWFVTPDDGAGWPEVFYVACQAAGFHPGTVHQFLGDQRQLQDLVAAGLGVAVVQATFPPSVGVVVKPLTGRPVWCRYVLAWQLGGVADEIVGTVHRCATAAYRDLSVQVPHLQPWSARKFRAPRP